MSGSGVLQINTNPSFFVCISKIYLKLNFDFDLPFATAGLNEYYHLNPRRYLKNPLSLVVIALVFFCINTAGVDTGLQERN